MSEREKFEEWAREKGLTRTRCEDTGVYFNQKTHFAWEAWQAVKADAVPDGWVVMPGEITEEIIEAYSRGKVFPASMGEHRKFVERLSRDYRVMVEVGKLK